MADEEIGRTVADLGLPGVEPVESAVARRSDTLSGGRSRYKTRRFGCLRHTD